MQLETMYVERDGRVATIVLNRPQVLNCANEQWARDLNTIVDDLAADNRLRLVVLRGGGRAFCSGIDVTALAAGETTMAFFRNWEAALRKLETMEPIVLAAVHSHCIGGGLDVNLFSQERRLNRGWSPQGKTYRQMETYCYEQPGTFCFSRPIYVDGSSVPRWLEFGLLKTDQTLWVETFEN